MAFSSNAIASSQSLAEFCKQGPDGLGSRLILKRTEEVLPNTDDRVWELTVIGPDAARGSFRVLTGRAFTQDADRNVSGQQAPTPIGFYSLSAPIELPLSLQKKKPELGDKYYIGITRADKAPHEYRRSRLAIHVYPSFGVPNNESGTEGCIGLDSENNMSDLVKLIEEYKIKNLYVCT